MPGWRRRKSTFDAGPVRDVYVGLVESGFTHEEALALTMKVIEVATAAGKAEVPA